VAIARERIGAMSAAEKLALGGLGVAAGVLLLRSMMRKRDTAKLVDLYAAKPDESIAAECVSRVHDVRDMLLSPRRRDGARAILKAILEKHTHGEGAFAKAKRSFVTQALDATASFTSFGMQATDDRVAPVTDKSEEQSVQRLLASQTPHLELLEKGMELERAALRERWASEKIPRGTDLHELVKSALARARHGKYGHIATWDVRELLSMDSAFFQKNEAGVLDLTFWDTRKVTSMRMMFSGFKGNVDVRTWDTRNVVDMSDMFMFANEFAGDVSGWNTSNVRNMSRMFKGATKFVGDIGGWKTDLVTDMSSMFSSAESFNGDISKWNTGRVTDMSSMFHLATSFNRDIGDWDTRRVRDMSHMFSFAKSFNGDIHKWNTGRVRDMSHMFSWAESFNRDIGEWKTGRVTKMESMFCFATSFDQNLSRWDVGAVRHYADMFLHAQKMDASKQPAAFTQPLDTGPIRGGEVNAPSFPTKLRADVPEKAGARESAGATTGRIVEEMPIVDASTRGGLDTPKMRAMCTTELLRAYESVSERHKIAEFCVCRVHDLRDLLLRHEHRATAKAILEFHAEKLRAIRQMNESEKAQLSFLTNALQKTDAELTVIAKNGDELYGHNWGHGNAIIPRNREFGKIFWAVGDDGYHGDYGPVATWDVRLVVNMLNGTVANNRGNFSVDHLSDLSFWDTRRVTNMHNMFQSFRGDVKVGTWDTSRVTNMSGMFYQATKFNGDIGSWNTSQVTDMSRMFYGAVRFTGRGDMGEWDTSNVKSMRGMFQGAERFTGSIGRWNTSKVTDMEEMFQGASVFGGDLSGWKPQIPNISMGWYHKSMTDGSLMTREQMPSSTKFGRRRTFI
jgi:surface protein